MEQRSKIRRPIIIDKLDTALPKKKTTCTQEAFEYTLQSRLNNVVANTIPPNPTLLPISFLQSITTPIFIIRHPAFFVPSFYRAARDAGYDVALDGPEFAIGVTLRWTRLLFEWFVAHNDDGDDTNQTNNSSHPILIESSDLIQDRSLMPRLCARLRLDPQYLTYTWDPTPLEARQANGPALAVFMHNLHESGGIMTAPTEREQDIVMEEERGRLVEEFGDDFGEGLWRFVEVAMPEWKYLRSLRF